MKVEKNVQFNHYDSGIISNNPKHANIFGFGTKLTTDDGKEFAVIDGKIYRIHGSGLSYEPVESFTHIL